MCPAGGGEQFCSKPAGHERPRIDAPDLLFFSYDFYCWKVRAGAAERCERIFDDFRLTPLLSFNPMLSRENGSGPRARRLVSIRGKTQHRGLQAHWRSHRQRQLNRSPRGSGSAL